MKVVALISGGKDSCFNMMQCVAEGHDLIALANLHPEQVDELDSYMFQTVGHHAIDLYAQAMDLPLYRATLKGGSVDQGRDYLPTPGDEVEDLYQLLKKIKEELQVEGVSVGAILSNYQRVRVESVCARLGLTPLAYLWRQDQGELLQEMIDANIHAIIIKVAALGLNQKHLGKSLKEIQPHMVAMKSKYHLNICGEGGEYETFTLDCPLFKKKIVMDSFDVVQHSDDAFSPVYFIHFGKMHLADKEMDEGCRSFGERIKDIKMKRGRTLPRDLRILDLSSDGARHDPRPPKMITLPQDSQRLYQPPSCRCGQQGFCWVSGVRATCKAEYSSSSILLSTEVAMETLKEQLKSNGYTLADAVLVHLYVRNMADFSTINSVYCRYFKLNPPARVCVQASLPEGTVLQLDCLAHHKPTPDPQGGDDGSDRDPAHYRSTMHVQGISHWAPANIGPYSQAVQIGSLVYCAGMIALCPSTMSIIEGGINAESTLSLRSITRVLSAMHQGLGLKDVVMATCYVSRRELIETARNHWQHALKEEEKQVLDADMIEAPSRFPGLVNYVSVASLPKGALVEWHVIADTNKQSWQYSKASSSHDGVCVEMETAWCTQSGTAAILARVDPSSTTKEVCLKSALERLVSLMVNQVELHEMSWSDFLSLKIFHSQDHISQANLNTALHSVLQQGPPSPIHFTCIPVTHLPPPCILNACVWIQKQPDVQTLDS